MPSISNLSQLKKILIANRGEIACRIMKTAKRLGIKTVAVYSEADLNSMHVSMADEAYCIGNPPPQESYLRGDQIVKVANESLAQAVHPGYGFLSENEEFAKHCSDNGIIFIGPPVSAIRDMGIKSTSKNIMDSAGVPIVPGYHGDDQSFDTLMEKARIIGFPLMIKAVRGGGGKGMRIVFNEHSFKEALESARRESLRAFGDDAVLLEKYIEKPRHIEVQVFGDNHNNYVHLFERDCSIQRRHQKVIELAPAPGIDQTIRNELGKSAVKAAQAVKYVGAGTVEFIFDTSVNKFYFMEMNTRLQVEHPITEMVTGVDLVEWQFRVASGEKLPLKQDDIQLNGNAVEARIYAENVNDNFLPTAGHIDCMSVPELQPNIRIETGIRGGDEISVHYDPMIAKLVVWEKDRTQAFKTMERSLSEFNIVGLENNVDFLRKLCGHSELINGNIHTGFIEDHKESLKLQSPSEKIYMQMALGVVLTNKLKAQSNNNADPFSLGDSFRINHVFNKTMKFLSLGKEFLVTVTYYNDGSYDVKTNETSFKIRKANLKLENGFSFITIETAESNMSAKLAISGTKIYCFDKEVGTHSVELISDKEWEHESIGHDVDTGLSISPMPGIVEKINVKKGDIVKKGDSVAVIIAMKMEYIIKAQCDGQVQEVYFSSGDNVGKNVALIKYIPAAS